MSPLGAVLFDMDGLLVDTEPVWTVAEIELAGRLGGVLTDELKATIVGTRLEAAVTTILTWYAAPSDPDHVAATSQWLLNRMVQLFGEGVTPMPGAVELLAQLRAAGVPVALVSSSYRVLVDAVLATALGPFDVTVAGDEVVGGKPDPEPYLLACARLGVRPSQAVVLEDSPAGVRSGERAGCAVVAVPSVVGVRFEPAPGRLVRSSLAGLTLRELAALVERG